MARTRRLALLGILAGMLLTRDAARTAVAPTEPAGDAAFCERSKSDFLVAERLDASLPDQLAKPAPPPKKPAPPGPRASRRKLALHSAPVPEKPLCEPPPAWSIGLRPTSFGMPDLRRIEPHLRFFAESKDGRAVVARWLQRAGKWRHVVGTALHANRMPLDLQALVYIESGYSPSAVSKAGAVGLWQLMPATARTLGLRVDNEVDERRSVPKSTEAALRHLSELYATFGSWELVFAAYDYGAKRLLQRMQEHGAMDYWTLSSIEGALPDETVDYVPKLLAFAVLLKNLDRFNFDNVDLERPIFTSELEVPGGTTFALLARASATSVVHLRELNPDILGGKRVPHGSFFTVQVPSFGLARAEIMMPTLLTQSDGLEDAVPEEFDWAKGTVSHKPLMTAASAKPAKEESRMAGFEDDKKRLVELQRPPRVLVLPSEARSTAATSKAASLSTSKPNKPVSIDRPAKRLPS